MIKVRVAVFACLFLTLERTLSEVRFAVIMNTSQSGTVFNRGSHLAIDKDINTCSFISNVSSTDGHAWWRGELDKNYIITKVYLSNTPNTDEAKILNGFKVFISRSEKNFEMHVCASVKSEVNEEGILNLTCTSPLFGKYVTVKRTVGVSKDVFVLCEISVEVQEDEAFEKLPIKNVKQSASKFLSNNVSRSIDGDINSCANVGDYQSDPWWRAELERIYDVKAIIISQNPAREHSTATVNKVFVYVSVTEDDFKEKLCFYHEKPKDQLREPSFNLTCIQAISGKYVTLLNTEKTMIILCEVVIYGSGLSVTLSYKKTTNQNDILFKSMSALAVDGMQETCTRVRAPVNELAWWRVTLDTVYIIKIVAINFNHKSNESVALNNFKVFVSNDYYDFEEHVCATFTDMTTENEETIFLTCDKPTPGKFITIKKYGGVKPAYLFLCEVYVYGDPFDHSKVCKEGEITCGLKLVCIDRKFICDGIKHCPDNDDERNCECPKSHYQCKNGQCVHKDWLCDSVKDCPYGDDENTTTCVSCSSTEFKCIKDNKCIAIDKRCDGKYDCPDSSDEDECLSSEASQTNDTIKPKAFLKAIYKGEPNFFICSSKWWSKFSLQACRNMDRAHISTTFTKTNATKILMLKTEMVYRNSPHLYHYKNSDTCKSGRFVQLFCSKDSKSECGLRKIPDTDTQLGPYIVNGDRAVRGAWPWHVQLINYRTSKNCGGTLLQYNWVLTSANCLENVMEPSEFYAKIGTVKNDDPMAKRYHFKKLIMHPDYLRSSLHGDIALLKINSSVNYSPFISPICLPPKDVLQSFIPYCVVTGFGNLDNEFFGWSWYLRQGRMNILKNKYCKKYLLDNEAPSHIVRRLFFSDDVICAGSVPTNVGVNICRGDFGGPLACKLKSGRWAVLGVASNTATDLVNKKCLVSIFNKVDPYIKFINKIINAD